MRLVHDLALLRYFDHLHRERHLTRAARRAGLSQPAMSRALVRMREAFGDPLFVRTPRGMTPTPRADALAAEVRAVLDAAEALVRPALFDPARLARTFTIGTADLFDAELIPRLIATLARIAPGVSVTTRPFGEAPGDALVTGRFDLVITVRAALPAEAMTARMYEDDFVCAVRRDHPGVGRRLTVERFAALPHLQIAPRGEPGGPVDTALEARGLARRVVMRVHTFLSAPAIVAHSDLILTAPRRVLGPLARPFGLRLLDPPLALPALSVWQGWHPRVHDDPAHAWFRTVVADSVARRGARAGSPR